MEFAFYWGRLTLNKCNVIPGSCEGSGKKKNTEEEKRGHQGVAILSGRVMETCSEGGDLWAETWLNDIIFCTTKNVISFLKAGLGLFMSP